MMTMGRLIALVLCTFCVSLGCGGGVVQRMDSPPPPPRGSGALQLVTEPVSAVIYVDGQYRGTVDRYRQGWISLEKGARRIALKAKNHYTWYELIEVGDEPLKRRVRLLRKPLAGD